MAKILELANVKLGSVVTDIMGVTGRAILEAMVRGEEDPLVLATLARGSLVRKRMELAEAVPGLIRDHHRFLLRSHLDMIDYLSARIEDLNQRIEEATRPFAAALALLESIPGDAGGDRRRHVEVPHGGAPRIVGPGLSRQSREPGKRRPVSTGKGNGWLRAALSQVAWAAVRTKDSHYRALYHRHKARGGPKKAIVAVQHAILVAVWHMFSNGVLNEDLGPHHFGRTIGNVRCATSLARLRKLGVDIEVQPNAA